MSTTKPMATQTRTRRREQIKYYVWDWIEREGNATQLEVIATFGLPGNKALDELLREGAVRVTYRPVSGPFGKGHRPMPLFKIKRDPR
jgi:hypothetical protein